MADKKAGGDKPEKPQRAGAAEDQKRSRKGSKKT